MKKTIYLAVLTIVTIVCILFGTFYHVAGRIGNFSSGIFVKENGSLKEGSFSDNLDAFLAIQMDIAVAEVIVQNGDGFSIEYEGSEALKPQYSVENNTLLIKSKTKRLHLPTSVTGKLVLTIPNQTELTDVVFDVDAGSIVAHNLVAKSMDIDVDAGNVEMYDSSCDKVTVDVDAGNVYWENGTFLSVEAKADMGNIEFRDCAFDVFEAEADLGNVEVHSSKSLDDYSMNIEVDLGGASINGRDFMGGYKVKGDSAHRVELKVSLGNAEITY